MATAEQSGLESSAAVIAGKWFLHDPVNEVNGDPRPDRHWMELAASAWSFGHDVAASLVEALPMMSHFPVVAAVEEKANLDD
jgi:hypothetical protein